MEKAIIGFFVGVFLAFFSIIAADASLTDKHIKYGNFEHRGKVYRILPLGDTQ